MAKKRNGPLVGNAVKHLNKRLGKMAKRGKLNSTAKNRLFSIRDQRFATARERNIQVDDDTNEAHRMQKRDTDAFHDVASDSEDEAPSKKPKTMPGFKATADVDDESGDDDPLPLDMLSDDDLEGEEGMQKRQFANDNLQNALRHLLPIKNSSGQLVQRSTTKEVELGKKGNKKAAIVEEEIDVPVEEGSKEPVMKTIEMCRLRIANLCQQIIENPQANVTKLRSLHSISTGASVVPSVRFAACKLATLSAMQVFLDIIPSYQIRSAEEEEGTGVKLRKETKSLMDFESSLLRYYRKYIQHLNALADYAIPSGSKPIAKDGDGERAEKYAHLATKCAATLLIRVPHFNFTANLVAMIVPLANSPVNSVREECCICLKEMFSTCSATPVARVVLQTTRAFNAYITEYQSNLGKMVHPDALSLLQFLTIKVVDYEDKAGKEKRAIKKKAKKHMNKKERKYKAQLDSLESELKETEASERREDRLQVHTRTMTQVFHIYFRILRRHTRSSLLSPVLTSLALHAPLVNVDFANDILDVLHGLVEDRTLSLWDSTRALHTACQLFTTDLLATAINVDPARFYSALYRLLPVLTERTIAAVDDDSLMTSCVASWGTALDCLHRLLITRRRHISAGRAAAFVKRLCLLALTLPHRELVHAVLLLVRNVIASNSTLLGIVDSECEGGVGVMGSTVAGDDPDHANALLMHVVVELNTLKNHTQLSRDGRLIATHLLMGLPSTGEFALPRALLDQYTSSLLSGVSETITPAIVLGKNKQNQHICQRIVVKMNKP